MGYFFIDDSAHDKAGFVIGACVYSEEDLSNKIVDTIRESGFDPKEFEFKSNAPYRNEPSKICLRDKLKRLLQDNCKLGVVIIPWSQRKDLGLECLKGVRQFIGHNRIKGPIDIYFDQGMFKSKDIADDLITNLDFVNCTFHFEQDSKLIYGIQVADLSAHISSIQVKDELGFITKTVKAGENSGYDQDLSISLGFEMWALLRYTFFTEGQERLVGELHQEATLIVEPYGLYISELCDNELAAVARKRFGTMYLGCIH